MKETLGKKISANRKRLGLTQEKLAEQLGVTAQAVSKWEHDQSCPDIYMLPKLADLFGISTDELLGLQNGDAEKVYAAEVVNDSDRQEGIHINKSGLEFHWDNSRRGSAVFAVWILLIGGLLLAARICDWSIGFWEITWTTGLIVFPCFSIFRKFSLLSLTSILVGGYFLLEKLEMLPFTLSKNLIFPLAVLVFGLSLLIDAFRKPEKPRFSVIHNGKETEGKTYLHYGESSFDCMNSFGENDYRIELPLLRSGEASVSFGELTLDLSGCEAVGEGCHLDASCSFGELTIRVPRRFRMDISRSGSFSDVDVDGDPDPVPQGIISLNASVNFGEISIEYL